MKEFLDVSEYIDFNCDLIISKAKELFKEDMTDEEKAKTAFMFVRDQIPHSFDCNAKIITASASDVLKHKTGGAI